MSSELTDLSVEQVDIVGKAANKRKWLLLKEDGLPQEIIDELLKDDPGVPMNDPPKEEDVIAQMKARIAELEAKLEDKQTSEEPTTKSDESEGGDQMENEELKKAQAEFADKLVKAEAEKAELVKAVADKDVIVKAQAKAARKVELESLCKSAGVDFEKVYALPEDAQWVVEKFAALTKQVDELLGKENGTARHDERALDFENRVAEVSKAEKIDYKAAGAKVALEQPELYEQYVKKNM
jgi:hypothetical protein